MREHIKLRAFVLADEIAIMIYKVTRFFPKEEMYGLTSQLRRASVSVPSNIVEGCARSSEVEFCRFLEIAYGSLKELHCQFGLSYRLGFMDEAKEIEGESKIQETEKVLSALIRKFRK
jgi:four helix bundle protein